MCVLLWMDDHASPRSCRVGDCDRGPLTAGHAECPVHSPCFTQGLYIPDACVTCSAWVSELRGAPVDQVRQVPAWSDLKDHLVGLSRAVLGLSPRPNLSFPVGFAAWFPSLFNGVSFVDTVESPGVSRTPPRSPTPVIASPVSALSSRMSKLEECLFKIQETLSARDRSKFPLPPPSKRARLSSPSRQDWFPPAAASTSDAASACESVAGGSGYGDDVSVAEADGLPPSASLGWEPAPDDWVVPPVTDGGELMGLCLEDDGETFTPLSNLEFRMHPVNGEPRYYWRVRLASTESTSSASTRVRLLTSALPKMAARVTGSPAPRPSIIPEKGKGRSGLGLMIGGSPVPSLLSWSDLPRLWSVSAAGNSIIPSVQDETRFDARPYSLDWAPGTPEHAVVGFLCGPPASASPMPSKLKKPNKNLFQEDSDARSEALRLFTVSSTLDLVTSLLKAAIAMRQSWSTSDYKAFMSHVTDAVQGSAAVLAPLTRDKVRAAVSKRVALREAAITEEISPVRSELLNVDPLSPCPYGSLAGVATILRSLPPPAKMVLDKGALAELLKQQSSASAKGGSGSRASSSDKFQGNRGGHSSRKSSPRRSGQQPGRSGQRPGSGTDNRRQRSSQNSREAGRDGDRDGGQGSSAQGSVPDSPSSSSV